MATRKHYALKGRLPRSRSREIPSPRTVASRIRAIDSLASGPRSLRIRGFQKAMFDRSPTVRMVAAEALGKWADRAFVPLLVRVLERDTNAVVRVFAAENLGIIRDEKAVRPLVKALRDPETLVRGWAALSLADIGKHASTAQILSALASTGAEIGE